MKNNAAKIRPKGGEAIKPVFSPPAPKSRLAPGNRIIKICTTADEMTWQNIKSLGVHLEMNKLELISHLAETTYKDEVYRKKIYTFYTEFWLRRAEPFTGEVTQNRLNLREDVAEMIRKMSWEVTGKWNRSEFIRLLVAYWAWEYSLLKFVK